MCGCYSHAGNTKHIVPKIYSISINTALRRNNLFTLYIQRVFDMFQLVLSNHQQVFQYSQSIVSFRTQSFLDREGECSSIPNKLKNCESLNGGKGEGKGVPVHIMRLMGE